MPKKLEITEGRLHTQVHEMIDGKKHPVAIFYGDGRFDNGKNNAEFYILMVKASELGLDEILSNL